MLQYNISNVLTIFFVLQLTAIYNLESLFSLYVFLLDLTWIGFFNRHSKKPCNTSARVMKTVLDLIHPPVEVTTLVNSRAKKPSSKANTDSNSPTQCSHTLSADERPCFFCLSATMHFCHFGDQKVALSLKVLWDLSFYCEKASGIVPCTPSTLPTVRHILVSQ